MWQNRARQNETNQATHPDALSWRTRLTVPHALAWLQQEPDQTERDGALRRAKDYAVDKAAVYLTHEALFEGFSMPVATFESDILVLRDSLGKPYVTWQGPLATWANARGKDSRNFHLSNTHDGGAHIVLAAYAEDLVGIGIDAVFLPRLRSPEKGRDYLLRFARQFMSSAETTLFLESAHEDDEEALRLRVAAHFSLMESASKACGTGLKIGAGMGKPTSLSKFALGVRSLAPETELLFDAEALHRLAFIGATRSEAYWNADEDFLISAVFLFR